MFLIFRCFLTIYRSSRISKTVAGFYNVIVSIFHLDAENDRLAFDGDL